MDPFVERLWLRARRYVAEHQIAAARAVLESLVQRDPAHVAARMLLAGVYLDDGHVREAAAQAVSTARMLPEDADTVVTTVHCLLRIGEMTAARECLLRFDARNRKLDGRQLVALAQACQLLGDHAAALVLLERAAAQGCGDPDFRYLYAMQLQANGRLVEARCRLEDCLASGSNAGRACLALARMHRQTLASNHLDFIRAQLRHVEQGSEDHAALEFAQFEELDALDRCDEAFAALARGNEVMRARIPRDAPDEAGLFDCITAMMTTDGMRGSAARIEGPVPIFIVGMPRSGTTLLDRILDNHPDVVSTGERTDFPRQLRWTANQHGMEMLDTKLLERLPGIDFAELGQRYLAQTQWRADGRPCYVDKLPSNFMLVGLIHRALPQAPILHMVRDPMDVCFSNYKALLGDNYRYCYRQDTLAAHYLRYRALMRHWHTGMPGRVLDVSYQGLVRNPEATTAAVFAHCGLRQVPGCSDLARNVTPVNTLSSPQVRGPIHARALGEWRRHAKRLAPLRSMLQSAGVACSDG